MEEVKSEQKISSDFRFHKVKLNNQQDESMICTELQKSKWYIGVDLLVDIRKQNLLQSVANELKQLNHLIGLTVTFESSSLTESSSIDSILHAIKSLFNLKYLKINFEDQSKFFESEDKLISLPILLDSLTNLETLILQSLVYYKNSLKSVFQKMVLLKEFVLNLIVENVDEYQNLNFLNQQINELSNIKVLQYTVSISKQLSKVKLRDPICFAFDKLTHLQELNIEWDYLEFELDQTCSQLVTLQSLIILKFQIVAQKLQDNFSKLFNTMFSLQNLEELHIVLKILKCNSPITIGEEVLETSKLKALKLSFYPNPFLGSTRINFCNQIKNIKCLEELSLRFLNSFFSTDSYGVLNDWSNEWKLLKILEIETFQLTFESFDYNYLFEFFKNRFQDLKLLSKLNITLQTRGTQSFKQFLTGLSQLKNLKSAQFQRLYQHIPGFQEIYVNCFTNWQNLRELRLDDISSKSEFLCLGKSFEHLSSLVSLRISFSLIHDCVNELDVFSSNLKYLKCLNSFFLKEHKKDENKLFGVQEVELLLNGIKSLNSLQQLQFTLNFKKAEIILKELHQTLQGLSNLQRLELNKDFRKKNGGNIIRSLKRLVLF